MLTSVSQSYPRKEASARGPATKEESKAEPRMEEREVHNNINEDGCQTDMNGKGELTMITSKTAAANISSFKKILEQL